jgi:hypothetical protein
MGANFNLKASLVVVAMLVLPVAQAASMSKVDYKTGKSRISADYKTDKAACAALAGNIKDICGEEAKAKEKVAKAELEFGYTGKSSEQKQGVGREGRVRLRGCQGEVRRQEGQRQASCITTAKARFGKT